jgi:hypothetical protein
MAADYKLEGSAALIAAFQAAGPAMRRDAGALVEASAARMAARVALAYRQKATATIRKYGRTTSDNLINSVSVARVRKGDDILERRINVTAPHGHLFEWGSVRRQTGRGYNRGAMPAGRVFVPAAVEARRDMVAGAAALLQGVRLPGFSGSPAVRVTRG